MQLDLTEKEKEGSVEGEDRRPAAAFIPNQPPELGILRPDPGQQLAGPAPWRADQVWGPKWEGRGGRRGWRGGTTSYGLVHSPHRAVLWLSPGHCSGPESIPAGLTPEAIWCVCWFPKGPVMYRKLHGSQLAAPAAPVPSRNTTPAT